MALPGLTRDLVSWSKMGERVGGGGGGGGGGGEERRGEDGGQSYLPTKQPRKVKKVLNAHISAKNT